MTFIIKDEQSKFIINVTEVGVFEFIKLSDTPNSYTGQANKLLQVNSTEDGIEFTDSPTVVDWDEIGGDQSDIKLSGFTDDYLTSNNPITYSAGQIGLDYNTTNLKLTNNELDTIQDISTSSSPEFDTIKLNALKSKTNTIKIQKDNNDDVISIQTDTPVANIYGTLNIYGDITQNGQAYETHAEKLYTTNDLIITRDGAVSGLNVGEYSGIQAKLYDGVNDGQLVFDKDGWARVGDVGDLQKLATIEETSISNGVPFYNSANYQLQTDSDFIYDSTGNILTIPNLKTAKLFPSTDSTTAIQINKANNTSNVVTVDTNNSRVGIGTSSPTKTLEVNGTSLFKGEMSLNSNKITNLANGVNDTDAINKSQLDTVSTDLSTNYVPYTGASKGIDLGSQSLTTTGNLSGNISATSITSNTLSVERGGTGRASHTAYALIAGGTTTTGIQQSLTAGSTGQILRSGGSSVLPSWSTATYPNTINANQALYATANNVIGAGTLPVSAGGTGATTFTAGRVLFGAGTSAINTNTNLFWDNTNSRLGIGTTTPTEKLHVVGKGLFSEKVISPFGELDEVKMDNNKWLHSKDNNSGVINMFKVNPDNEIDVGGTLNIGTISLPQDAGQVSMMNLPVSSASPDNLENSYTFNMNSDVVLKVHALSDGAGGVKNKAVIIATEDLEVPDTSLSNGQTTFYLDETSNTLTVKCKYSDGTVKTGTIALS